MICLNIDIYRYTNYNGLSILSLLKYYIVNVDEYGDDVGVWDPYAQGGI